MSLSPDDYREGAPTRLEEANQLYGSEKWVSTIYLAGRAVEALFRCLLLGQGKSLEVGHDLRSLLKRMGEVLPDTPGTFNIEDAVNQIAAVWKNDLRFCGEARMARILKQAGRTRRIGSMSVKGDPLKANARVVLEACERIVARGEPICRRFKTG
ncbi:MAG: HEPN domain-containing protein [Phycisphaerales bacterium]|nr:HEPN domain-containing protein [Phycisphaerales bacterium]